MSSDDYWFLDTDGIKIYNNRDDDSDSACVDENLFSGM